MIEVQQDRFGEGIGNCLPACAVSILEIPDKLEELSDFLSTHTDWMSQRLRLAEWLNTIGMTCIPLTRWDDCNDRMIRGVTCVADGISPRGIRHAVVWKDGVIFDPHPDGGGIKSVDTYLVFVQLDKESSQ